MVGPTVGSELRNQAIFASAIALAGIVAKICWLSAPRILYTLLYLAMGWAVLFDWSGFSQMPSGCLTLIALGGIAYTIGAVIYMIKKPDLSKQWGFHELFHLFILHSDQLAHLPLRLPDQNFIIKQHKRRVNSHADCDIHNLKHHSGP